MPFTPWLEHTIANGTCIRCGIVPVATVKGDPTKAYTHANGIIIEQTPLGRFVKCEGYP